MLPPGLKRETEQAAESAGVSFSEFTRRALREAIARRRSEKNEDPLFDFRNVFSGKTPPDLAQNHDDYLYVDED